MSDCLHCDIHELLESQLQSQEVNLAEIAGKVTEVLADLNLMAPPDEQSKLMADILANLGSFLLEMEQSADPTNPVVQAISGATPCSSRRSATPFTALMSNAISAVQWGRKNCFCASRGPKSPHLFLRY
jgi:hypothetical protein